mgnify:CR=1 FL=1
MKKLLLLIITLVGTMQMVPAQAANDLTMTGLASYEELRRPYYIGALYMANPSNNAEEILSSVGERRMEMKVTARSWSPRRFSMQWTQAMILNVDPGLLERHDDAFVQFNNLPKQSFKQGDKIVIDSNAKGQVTISVNGTEIVEIARPGFFEVLLSTWIGRKPPSSDFKAAMLGSIDGALLAEYEAMNPSEERVEQVAAWMDEGEGKAAKEVAVTREAPAATAAAATAATATAVAAATADTADTAAATSAAEAKPVQVAMAKPQPAPVIEEEEEELFIDPEIYRIQQATLLKLYKSSVIKRTLRQVQYPKNAVRRNQQGKVLLDITVDRTGQILSIFAKEEARYNSLNDAAVAAVNAAGDFPAVPAALEGQKVTVTVPVTFKLN